MATPSAPRTKLIAFVFVVVTLVAVVTPLAIIGGARALANDVLAIFLVGMLLGMAGAGVFVVVQLFAEGQAFIEKIAQPRGPVSGPVLLALFMISGGLVAAAAQASVGTFVPGNIWTTFLLGFGWQGAVSGIEGSTASRARAAEVDAATLKDDATEVAKIKDDARRMELERAASLLPKI